MATASELLTLAMQHHPAGHLSDAERLYRHVLQHEPHQARALYLLGLLTHQVGHLDGAIAYYKQALALQPNYLEAHNNLGAALQEQGNVVDAIAHYQMVLRLKPENPNANINLGVALQKQGKLDAAITRYQKAIRLDASRPEAHSNLGHALKERGAFEQSIAHYRMALQLTPHDPEAHCNLSEALQEQGQTDDAIALLDAALALHPAHIQLQGSRIRATLMAGNLREGFTQYDRWRLARSTRSFTQPIWDGSDLNGARILLYTEPGSGFGDTLQFVRYAPLVAQRGDYVIVECQEPLLRLLETIPGVDTLVATGTPLPAFDLQASLLSLPFLFGTTSETIPVNVPYVGAPPPSETTADLARTADLAPTSNDQQTKKRPLQVGLVWGCPPKHLHDQERSCPLSAFSGFLTTPGVTFYSLQKGVHRVELVNAGALPIHDWNDRLTDFTETAAAMDQLDLVISVDTAVAHLAGAMAKPVWVLLAFASDWRWMMHSQTSPWYPTAQLFRQPRPQDWGSVCIQVAQALDHLVKLQ